MFRRLLLLAPVGVLAGHLTGYAAVGYAHADGVSHAHLPLVAALGLPMGIWALATCVRERGDAIGRSALAGLIAAQALGFLAMEVAERAAVTGGTLPTVTEPAVLAGLAAQLIVAAVLLATVRITQIAVDALSRSSTPARPAVSIGWRPRGRTLPLGASHVATNPGRAPPVLLVD